MAEYLMGIDNGLTVSKVAIFDLEGHEICTTSRKRDGSYPHPGWTERDIDTLWQDTAEAIREAITRSGIKPQEILAVGNAGHGNGVYLLDRHNAPLRPAILSMDTRAGDMITEWYSRGVYETCWPDTQQTLWPAQPGALLRWLKLNEPETYTQIGTVLLCKDYIKYRLTGTLTTDLTDTSCGGLLDVFKRQCTAKVFEQYEISEVLNAVPPIVQSADVIGSVTQDAAQATGLKAGTPVIGGLLDGSACAIGAGAIQPGQISIIAGTWSINQVVTAAPIMDKSLFVVTLFIQDRWLTQESSATSATNLEWFVNQCCGTEQAEAQRRGISVYEVCSELVASLPPGGTDVIFHPFLFGSNVQPTARAGFYGVAGWHTKVHLLRSVYEGVVYSHRSHIDKLRAAGAQMDVARFTGGGSRSRVWTQIFADTIELPMEIPVGTEIGARGAAMCAGVGVGAYRDYDDAVEKAVRIERRQEPNSEATAQYLARYTEYRYLTDTMREAWERLSRLKR
jgi:L-xylulokinase